MFTCPNCRQRLVRVAGPKGIMFVCPRCGGRAVGMAVIRRSAGEKTAKALWLQGMKKAAAGGKKCPVCGRWMREIPVPVDGRQLLLDLCRDCRFVWFDSREFEQLPVVPEKPTSLRALPMEAREKIAVAQVKLRSEMAKYEEPEAATVGGEPPEEPWKWIPAVFGFPVEIEVEPVQSIPWVTWGLGALLVAVYLLTFRNLEAVIQDLGFIPDQAFRLGGATWLTSFFLHGGPLHLLANTYFLLIFGDNVEDYLGRWRYLALLVLATLCGNLAHMLLDPRGDVPAVGASGGISGVIVFYALQFPRAQLAFFVRWLYWLRMPAYVALLLWIFLQFLGAAVQIQEYSEISSVAHLGGALVGVLAWIVWRNR
jgi:membrane associated rhomboid family serine protease/Zn-finger nucleic acid-binding protein